MAPTGGDADNTILFHHPHPLAAQPRTGSQIRPVRMRDAFRSLGYEVVEVTGFTTERLKSLRQVMSDIDRGRRFAFCYSECTTMPTALSDPNHMPLHPFADPLLFRGLKKAGIPSGLFYRDVYWRFDEYREQVPIHKRALSIPLYRFDLLWYSKFVDIVYLPSLGMADSIPGAQHLRLAELPPAFTPADDVPDRPRSGPPPDDGEGPLRLFYVGSVTPPIYDVTPLLSAVRAVPGIELTLCCPESERDVLETYPEELRVAVDVVHVSGAALTPLYERSDVACLVMGSHPYRDFAMPVKLFEAIGHHRPIIASRATAAGRFVEENELGWTFEEDSEVMGLLKRLLDDRLEVSVGRDHVRERADAHTWTARAAKVADDLIHLDR